MVEQRSASLVLEASTLRALRDSISWGMGPLPTRTTASATATPRQEPSTITPQEGGHIAVDHRL